MDWAHGAAIDNDGGIVMVGEFVDEITFEQGTPREVTYVAGPGSEAMYIARYGPNPQ